MVRTVDGMWRYFGIASVERVGLWLACIVSVACGTTGDEALPSVSRQAVEATALGVYYDLAFVPAPSLPTLRTAFPGASNQELAALFSAELGRLGAPNWSSASVTAPAVDTSGTPLVAPEPATDAIRYSCGATLISPSYVVTAGHCVAEDEDLTQLELQLYRPTAALSASYATATVLSGSWPLFTHAALDLQDGYVIDEYPCTIESRCWEDQSINCPYSTFGADVAVLRCDGRPGAAYGFVNVHLGDAIGKEALMHWKHEVYAVPSEPPLSTEFIDHYVSYPPDPTQNYHYFASTQLLPLRSIDASGLAFFSSTYSNVRGCHGSSGSGLLLRPGEAPRFELVAPLASAGGMSGTLCHQLGVDPAIQIMGGNWSDRATLMNLHTQALADDCADQDVATLWSHLDCQPSDFAHAGTAAADAALGPYREPYLADAGSEAEHVIDGFSVATGQDYRFGMHVVTSADCGVNCGTVALRAGTSTETLLGPGGPGPAQLVNLFAASSDGPLALGIQNVGTARDLGALVFIREGRVNSFDSPSDRLEAALYAIDQIAGVVGPAPMRFVGDGANGFAARLEPSERMALLRQAIAPGRIWTLRMAGESFADLHCGLLSMQGAPLLDQPCASLVKFDDSAGSDGRLGVYVELESDAPGPISVESVALASDHARDDDADEVPDVLDNCPTSWNPSQGICDEQPPDPGNGGAAGQTGSGGQAGEGGMDGAAEGGQAGQGSDSPSAGTGGSPSAGTGGSVNGGTGGSLNAGSGTTEPSAGAAGDDAVGAVAASSEEGGCGCRHVRSRLPPSAWWGAALVLAAMSVRVRTRRRR